MWSQPKCSNVLNKHRNLKLEKSEAKPLRHFSTQLGSLASGIAPSLCFHLLASKSVPCKIGVIR